MKQVNRPLLWILITVGSLTVVPCDEIRAQYSSCPPVPDSSKWMVAKDYGQSRDSVEKLISWLCRTPFGANVRERSEANACVLIWLAGTPELRMEIDTRMIPFVEVNEELLYSFIHGWANYALSHPREKDRIKLYEKGFGTVAALASQSESLSHEKSLKSLLRAYRRGHLREYTEEVLATGGKY